ncbi:MAG: hypothetical protein AAFY88_19365, partial [Acidobacteriota bacterium]
MLSPTPTIRYAPLFVLLLFAPLLTADGSAAQGCADDALGALSATPGSAVQVLPAGGGGAGDVRVGFGPADDEALLLESKVEGSEGVFFVVPTHPDGLAGGVVD